jgi:hypothetical protein
VVIGKNPRARSDAITMASMLNANGDESEVSTGAPMWVRRPVIALIPEVSPIPRAPVVREIVHGNEQRQHVLMSRATKV